MSTKTLARDINFGRRGNEARGGMMERLAVNIREAARLTSLSVHTLRSYSRKGRIATVRVGRRVLFPVAELQRLVQQGAPQEAEKATSHGDVGESSDDFKLEEI